MLHYNEVCKNFQFFTGIFIKQHLMEHGSTAILHGLSKECTFSLKVWKKKKLNQSDQAFWDPGLRFDTWHQACLTFKTEQQNNRQNW